MSGPSVCKFILEHDGVSLDYGSVISFFRERNLLRTPSERAKCIRYNTSKECRHCNSIFVADNPAQVYCRVCCPNHYRDYERLKRYNLSRPEFENLWSNQKGLCKICDKQLVDQGATGMNVDHCHQTGVVRGLLCHFCNMVVGFLDKGDWKARMQTISDYINQGHK